MVANIATTCTLVRKKNMYTVHTITHTKTMSDTGLALSSGKLSSCKRTMIDYIPLNGPLCGSLLNMTIGLCSIIRYKSRVPERQS